MDDSSCLLGVGRGVEATLREDPNMRLVGVRQAPGAPVNVAALSEDGMQATLLATLEAFWADPVRARKRASGEVVQVADVELVPPVLPSARILCLGVNYAKHAAEGSYKDQELPPYPTIFGRWPASLTVDGAAIPVPSNEAGLDWEGEILAIVERPLIDATPDEARAAVIGYSTFNDVTSRKAQKLTSQWVLGKNGDRSGPMGPIITTDEAGDLREGLQLTTRVNGEVVQDGNTRDMIHEVGDTLSLISHTMTLYPGDMIATGTPEGVGYARTPPWLLQPGDVVEVEVERIGKISNPIVANAERKKWLAQRLGEGE